MILSRRFLQVMVFSFAFVSVCMSAHVDNKISQYQRYIIIHNDLPFPIFPVLQVSNKGCFEDDYEHRIMISKGSRNAGIPSKQTIKVNLPNKCWYDAGRVLIFTVPILEYEKKINQLERTIPKEYPSKLPLCVDENNKSVNGCFTGYAKAVYLQDAPAQLTEYTFNADDPITGGPAPTPDSGVPMVDVDVSYVDNAYLPVAMAVDDGGVLGYMGTTVSFSQFKKGIIWFVENAGWSPFGAYGKETIEDKRSIFYSLLPKEASNLPNIPGGYNLFKLINSNAETYLYTPKLPDNNPSSRLCSKNPQCVFENVNVEYCCPNANGAFLGCCNNRPYMVDATNVSEWRVDQDGALQDNCLTAENSKTPLCKRVLTNPNYTALSNIWFHWSNSKGNSSYCNNSKILQSIPVEDKKNFCLAFESTVKNVFNIFSEVSTPIDDCVLSGTKKSYLCTIQQIIGYIYPDVSGSVPESVQALLRNVPYIDPQTNPSGQFYQYDKWLLFQMPYRSVFNLDRYTRFIHYTAKAVAYSFSIDDKYGNLRTPGSGFIINVGGDTKLVNKQPFDPYEQYFANWGPGWDRATVCGRDVKIYYNPKTKQQVAGNARISFLKSNTNEDPTCEVTLYKLKPTKKEDPVCTNSLDDSCYNTIRVTLKEKQYSVTDNYTGESKMVTGLNMVGCEQTFSVNQCIEGRTNLSPVVCQKNPDCIKHPSECGKGKKVLMVCSDIAYVSVNANERPNVYLNLPDAPIK